MFLNFFQFYFYINIIITQSIDETEQFLYQIDVISKKIKSYHTKILTLFYRGNAKAECITINSIKHLEFCSNYSECNFLKYLESIHKITRYALITLVKLNKYLLNKNNKLYRDFPDTTDLKNKKLFIDKALIFLLVNEKKYKKAIMFFKYSLKNLKKTIYGYYLTFIHVNRILNKNLKKYLEKHLQIKRTVQLCQAKVFDYVFLSKKLSQAWLSYN